MISFKLAEKSDFAELQYVEEGRGEVGYGGTAEALAVMYDVDIILMFKGEELIGYAVIAYGRKKVTMPRIVVKQKDAIHTLKLAQEVKRVMLESDAEECICIVEKDNLASLNLANKVGLRVVGEISQATPKDVYILQGGR